MKRKKSTIVISVMTILNGILCILFNQHLFNYLPMICGSIILLKGMIRLVRGIREKDYAKLDQTNLEKSFVSLAIGLGILIRQQDAIFVIGVFWGIYGLLEAVDSFNVAFYAMTYKEKYMVELFKGIIGFVLSLLLIFDPSAKVGHHIIILGVELIFEGVIALLKKRQERIFI